MQAAYIARRFLVFLLIVWLAASLNFFLPRLSGQDPGRTKLQQSAQLGGYVHAGIEEMVKEYNQRFGLDKPLWRQYLTYLHDTTRLDFNYSIANYPRTVREMIAEALPWTIGLLGVTTLLSFGIGTFLGALLAWPGAPHWLRYLMPPLWALHAIPFFLLGLILMYLLALQVQLLPIFGGYSAGTIPSLSVGFVLDVLAHALLPAMSIVLVATGGGALGRGGMMVTTMGEDYVTFAEAKGLKSSTVFLRYCLRNAILPQTTALALALGQVLSGAVLVEVIFGYPVIGALGVATFVLDVVYPWLDSRISYRRT